MNPDIQELWDKQLFYLYSTLLRHWHSLRNEVRSRALTLLLDWSEFKNNTDRQLISDHFGKDFALKEFAALIKTSEAPDAVKNIRLTANQNYWGAVLYADWDYYGFPLDVLDLNEEDLDREIEQNQNFIAEHNPLAQKMMQ